MNILIVFHTIAFALAMVITAYGERLDIAVLLLLVAIDFRIWILHAWLIKERKGGSLTQNNE